MSTRTAPLFTAPVSRRLITMRLIDQSGDLYSESFVVGTGASAASIEALAAAYAAATQASLYSIVDTLERNGIASIANADTGSRDSIKNGINTLYKVPSSGESTAPRLVAPQPAVMVGTTDTPNLLATEWLAWESALDALLVNYAFVSAQFTERRERKNNTKAKG